MAGNPLLEALRHEPARGALSVDGVRYLLIRPETLLAVQQAIEDQLPGRSAAILHAAGRSGGQRTGRRFREAFPRRDPASTLRAVCELGTDAGWGRLELVATEPITVEVDCGPLAETASAPDGPVCHLLRGVLAGIVEGVLGTPVVAREDICAAVSGDRCRFVIDRLPAVSPP